MRDAEKTKEQLIIELAKLRRENSELKITSENKDNRASVSKSISSIELCSLNRHDSSFSFEPGYQPANNSRKYHISELVDIPLLQQLLTAFYRVTGISHTLLDTDNNILSKIGWQNICTQFHRLCPQTEARCKQSDSYISQHLQEGNYIKYKCLNGLLDCAIPIIIEGQHLATIFKGQILHEPPDEDYFRCQAREFGFDEANYMEALSRIPIIPTDEIDSIMEFYSILGQLLASMGMERLRGMEAAVNTLREQEERLRLVLEGSTDAFWDWNLQTGEMYRSPRWGEILGYSGEEIEPNIDPWVKLLHPDDKENTIKTLNKHLDGDIPNYEVEYRMLTKSGEWKWILERGRVVTRDKQGKPLRAAGTCLDITERKQAENALIQSEEKFSKAFQFNPDPMSIITLKEGCYVEVNDAFWKATGYGYDEVIGHTIWELDIWDVDPDEAHRIIEKIYECGNIRNIETKFRLKSGEIRDALLSIETLDLNGEALLIVTTRDITERIRMEQNLRESKDKFYKAFHGNADPMSITTPKEGRYIEVNDAYLKATGYKEEEVIGYTAVELGIWAVPEDRDMIVKKLLEYGSIRNIETKFKTKLGDARTLLLSGEIIDMDGEALMLITTRDITELRQIEREMTRLDRLNLVGEMAASIGHEIRNPMTTVRGYLQLLQTNKKYCLEREYFDLMIEELDRANSIITEFLSLAKDKVVELKPTNINTIITKLVPLVQAEAISRDQHIKLELGEIPDLLLDHKEISQLILNLVNNGMESMTATGYVIIKTYIEKEKAILAVKDKGNGITIDLLDKLGTPFFTTKENGTGLGLAVCYRIANRHNAHIDIETGSAGTTFYVRFPINREAQNF